MALLLVPMVLAVIGVVLELVFFRPLQHRSHIELGLVTFGLALMTSGSWCWSGVSAPYG